MNNNMTGNINYELTQSGNCPLCKKKLRVVEYKKTMYKGLPTWVYEDMSKVEVRCQECNIILIDKIIA